LVHARDFAGQMQDFTVDSVVTQDRARLRLGLASDPLFSVSAEIIGDDTMVSAAWWWSIGGAGVIACIVAEDLAMEACADSARRGCANLGGVKKVKFSGGVCGQFTECEFECN